jgi:plasmid stabilization system protein ParE
MPSKYKVLYSRFLDDDINELMEYFSDLSGDDTFGVRLKNEIHEAIESLKTFPNGNPMWNNDPTVRRINLKKRRVAIIYVINDDKLEVIAAQVFHALGEPKRVRKLIRERLKTIAK